MALSDLKLKDSDYSGKDVSALPDRPNDAGYTAAQLKAAFDHVGEKIIGARINQIIDLLISTSGAGNIGASVTDMTGKTAAALLTELKELIDAHGALKSNPHEVTKEQVGLGNADNTSDEDKPISTAQAAKFQEMLTMLSGLADEIALKADADNVLTRDNTDAYTPSQSYHPATKKYVDDQLSESGYGDMMKTVYDQNGDGMVDSMDGGTYGDEAALAVHLTDESAHETMTVDGNAVSGGTDAETLEEHMTDASAHGNLNIDGNESA